MDFLGNWLHLFLAFLVGAAGLIGMGVGIAVIVLLICLIFAIPFILEELFDWSEALSWIVGFPLMVFFGCMLASFVVALFSYMDRANM